MRIYTGQVIINNGKYDKAFQVRVFANSYHIGLCRAGNVALKEFRKGLLGKRPPILYLSVSRLQQSKPVTLIHRDEYVDKAWLV